MRTKIVFWGLILLSLQAAAQLRNPSFESTDSTGSVDSWTLTQGRSTRLTVEQFGLIPFTAHQGNYFILFESDTISLPINEAHFSQTFPLADTPASFYLHHLYIPENTAQTAGIKLLMTHWNGTSRDTILWITDSVHVVANGNQIPIQWNTFGTTLQNRYHLAQLPDTATLTLTNNLTPTGKNIRWYVDDLSFGKWAVGLAETNPKMELQAYPNPASEHVWVNLNQKIERLVLMNIQGVQQDIDIKQLDDAQYLMNTQSLPSGLYFLCAMGYQTTITQRISIQH